MAVATATALAIGTIAASGGAAAATAYGAHRTSDAAEEGARLQSRSADKAAGVETKDSVAQLDFLKTQDARQNAQYLEEQQYARQQEAARLARLAPFRQTGLAALGQLMTPINQNRSTLGDVVR